MEYLFFFDIPVITGPNRSSWLITTLNRLNGPDASAALLTPPAPHHTPIIMAGLAGDRYNSISIALTHCAMADPVVMLWLSAESVEGAFLFNL